MNRCARLLAATCVALLTATSAAPAQAAVEPGPMEVVSASAGGVPGNDLSRGSRGSANGRFVAFWSLATDLIEGVSGENVFLRRLEHTRR